jgi:hypothetical protein
VISKEDYAVIKSLDQRGINLKDIAAELGVLPWTVSRALKRGSSPQRERKRRSSKLDAYKVKVDRLLSDGVGNFSLPWQRSLCRPSGRTPASPYPPHRRSDCIPAMGQC